MKSTATLPFALALCVLAACADDSDGGSTSDAGTDVGADVGVDASTDVAVDAPAELDTSIDTAIDTAPAPNSLEAVHAEVIMPTCGGLACHLDGRSSGGINLDLDDTLADRLLGPSRVRGLNLVVPGDPDSSYFYLKLTGEHTAVGGSGSRMPLGRGALTSAQIELVAEWIRSL